MIWKDIIVHVLEEENLFHNDVHHSQFKELVNCYQKASFFTPGMCKCMYLGSWDEEHFFQILDMLNTMSVSDSLELQDMVDNGKILAEQADISDKYLYLLSCAFIEDVPFDAASLPAELDDCARTIITMALKAASVIDDIFYPNR